MWTVVVDFLYQYLAVPSMVVAMVVAIAHIMYWNLRVSRNWDRTARMIDVGGYARFYFCAIMQSFHMEKGVFTPLGKEKPSPATNQVSAMGIRNKVDSVYYPDTTDEKMVIVDCYMFHQSLSRYRRCIDFKGDHMEVPPVFMSVYFNKSLIALGSSELSRSPILGAVHFRQQVTVYQDLSPLHTSLFSLSCNAEEYRITEKGVEVDIMMKIFDEHEVLVWEAVMTGISLLPNNQRKRKLSSEMNKSQIIAEEGDFVPYKEDLITTHNLTGLRFAKASIDYQPQHLWGWSAKMVGFNKPIAHGLWTMAAAVERIVRSESCYKDVYPLQLETSFRRPLVLGDSGLLHYEKPDGEKHLSHFKVINPKSKLAYVTGKIYVGAKDKKETL